MIKSVKRTSGGRVYGACFFYLLGTIADQTTLYITPNQLSGTLRLIVRGIHTSPHNLIWRVLSEM